jgi:Cu/Ag efflux pump CusA
LYGNDLDILDKKADEIAKKFEQTGNLVDISVRAQEGMPTLAIRLDFNKMAVLGFRAVDVLDILAMTFQGTTIGQSYKGRIRTDIVMLLDADRRLAPEEIEQVALQSLSGAWYSLKDIAEVRMYRGRETIEHEGQRRKQTIVAHFVNLKNGISEKISKIIDTVLTDTPDVTYTVLNTNKVATDTSTMIIGQVALVTLVLALLLRCVLREFSRVVLVLVNIPFSCIGGIIAMYFYQWFCSANGEPWTLGTLIGFITLFGMTMRTSIMLLTHYDHLVIDGGAELCNATIVQGATERLIPILMTSIVTGLGLLPIALTPHQAGHEIEGPMAWVIVGGLFTSTVLSLLVLPVMVSLFNTLDLTRKLK